MITNGKPAKATALEAELVRLNALVRERRKQMARLEKCPNKDCPCRFIWREHVEKNLAGQVGKIQWQVRGETGKSARLKARPHHRRRLQSGKARRGMARGQSK